MELMTFLRRVLPEDGVYCSATRRDNGGWSNTSHRTIEQLANACLAVSNQGRDVWYGTASYERESELDPRFDTHRFRRTQNNVKALKALRLDVDVNPNKDDAYSTIKTALGALKDFLLLSKLPLPLVVHSGYGLHIYWTFTTAVAPDTWLYMAEQLRGVCAGLGFKVDNSGTTDSARVLRPPQTNNHKRGNVREVRVLLEGADVAVEDLQALLHTASEPYTHLIRHHKPKAKVEKPPQQLPQLLERMLIVPDSYLESQKRYVGPIVRECQQVREAGLQSEPTWHRMISLMKLCHRGDEAIHILSKVAVNEYDSHKVDEKIASSEALPITCAEFNNKRPDVCTNCKHWQCISSPIQLGVKAVPIVEESRPLQTLTRPAEPEDKEDAPTGVVIEGTAEDNTETASEEILFVFPDVATSTVRTFNATQWRDANYELSEHGCWLVTNDDTGTRKTQITPYVIKPVSLFRAANGDKQIRWQFFFDKDRPPELVDIPMVSIHDPNAVVNAFASKGMTLGKIKGNKLFSDFIKDYFYNIHQAGAMMRLNKYSHLGWGEDNEFVLGDKIILPDGSVVDEPDLPFGQWAKTITQAGTLSDWVGAVKHMFTPAEMAKPALMFLHGFASPLMRYFYGTEASLTFVVGETGVGKSTLASLMWSIWAKPFAFPKGAGDLNSSAGTTMNSLFREASILHCLPFYIDEATLWTEQNAPSYVYDISSGQEKKRLDANLQQRESGTWRTTAMATSNTSLRMKISNVLEEPQPLLMRIIEFTLPKINYGNKYVNDIKVMHANYGHAGVEYARFLTANAASGRLEKALDAHRTMISERFNMQHDERYWTSWATCIYTGMELSRQAGLHSIDAEVILNLMGRIIDDQRGSVSKAYGNRESWFGEMLSDLWPSTLVVANSQMLDRKGRTMLTTVRLPMQGLAVRTNTTTGVTYISIKAIRKWCSSRKVRYEDFIDALDSQAKAYGELVVDKETRYSLGAGVAELQSASAPVKCLRVKVSPDMFGNFLESEE